jgi:hypothetical protein
VSFQWWNDGDAGFVRTIWCLVRHLRPRKIVETGVAHGVTSRFILEALKRNGDGHLWSIDLPPLERQWREQVGVAVGDRFPDRWSYIRGSSRRHLPNLLSQLGEIDLFIHDSLHSERNVRFEIDPRVRRTTAPFLFRCPNTGYCVQGRVADDGSQDARGLETVSCHACQQVHLVNPSTGRVLGVD